MNAKSGESIGRPYWNYRVINHGDWLGLHEVYYNKGGKLEAYTLDAVGVTCHAEEGIEALGETLAQMRRALTEPMLTPEDFAKKRRTSETR